MRNLFCRIAALLALLSPASLHALTFNITYDSSVGSLTNAAQVEAAFATAAHALEAQYTNVALINITVYWGNAWPYGSVSLGVSETELTGNPDYSQLVSALTLARSSLADTDAVASLPANDPTGGGPWWVSRAQAKVLSGLGFYSIATNDPSDDGYVGFDSTVSYTFDPTNRAVAGKYDFIGVAEHEISEVLGRGAGLNYGGFSGYVPYDLFRFSASGLRSLNALDTNVYFSVNNGLTPVRSFYTNANDGDIQDWLPDATPDSYDAFAYTGRAELISPADIDALDVIGYNTPGISPLRVAVRRFTNGTAQVVFTNLPSVSFTILASTNLLSPVANWTVLGHPTEISAGQYKFTDTQAGSHALRFYRVRSP